MAEVGTAVVIMSLEQGNYFALDEIGADVWRRLATPIRVSQLCSDLSSCYDGDAVAIERDATALLVQLASHELIETASEGVL